MRLFGEEARDYKAFYYKDWSQDDYTVTPGDTLNIESFPTYGQPPAYIDNVYFAGTEYDAKMEVILKVHSPQLNRHLTI